MCRVLPAEARVHSICLVSVTKIKYVCNCHTCSFYPVCTPLLVANATEVAVVCYRPCYFGRFVTEEKLLSKWKASVANGALWVGYR